MRWILALAILLLTGCSTSVDGGAVGVAVTATTDAEPVPWDPCTIPDSAVEAAGLNVATKESGIFGRDQNGYKICTWDSGAPDSWYALGLFAGEADLESINSSSTFDRRGPTQVGQRDAIQYQAVGADGTRDCQIAFGSGTGLVNGYLVTSALVRTATPDSCTELTQVLAALEAWMPR